MTRLNSLLIAAYFFFPMQAFAQKIVFSDEFNTKNISFSSAGGVRIVEDSITKERVFIYSGKKETIFYQLDANWKIIKKLSKDPAKDSKLSEANFRVLKFLHNKDKWSFIVEGTWGYSKETVDFASGSHTVDGQYIEDIAKGFREMKFLDGADTYVMYLNKDKQLNLTNFNSDLTAKNTWLDLSTSLPAGKSKKISTEDLYAMIGTMDSFRVSDPYFSRRKVQFYVMPDRYDIVIAGDEPIAELNRYDKKTGKRIKNELYSLESILPAGSIDKKYNSSAILFDNKIHVLAANKSGGAYAVFDVDSKKILYQYVYSEKDQAPPFNYGPVRYETLPGTISTSVLKEKLDDISMDKFCSEMYKHSCAVTARRFKDGRLLVTLANYDMKELAAATSHLRSGLNTMTSPSWYVSTSAGLIFAPGGFELTTKKTTWNEINGSSVTDKYKRVEAETPDRPDAEYNDKSSYVFNTQFIGNRRYTIYFTRDKEIKIDEKVLKNALPMIMGITD